MKQSDDNRIVTVVFICEDDKDAERVMNETNSLASERGCNLLTIGMDKPDDEQEALAEELGIYNESHPDDIRGRDDLMRIVKGQ